MSDRTPLVSCIMPTADRRRFVPLAVRSFMLQDYASRELIVMDDGADAIEDLLPDDDRIHYLRVPPGRSLGAKRNACCRQANGALIAHWDDDDWMAPGRLSRQVRAMVDAGTDACGLDRLYFCNPSTGEAWMYRYPDSQRAWVAGGTLLYRRSIWERQPFPDITSGEDTRFVWALSSGTVQTLDATDMYVARVHSKNTSPKKTHASRWHLVGLETVRRVVGSDWPLFAGQRSVEVPDPPSPKTASPDTVTVEAACDDEATSSERSILSVESGTGESTDRRHSGRDARPPVTVSLPYYQCRDHVRRAVTSILEQTYAPLRLVVVNDGDPNPPWDLLDDIDDPRLIRFDLSANRGRYAADDVVLSATDDPFFLVQDADDWSTPDRLEKLMHRMRETHAEAVFSDQIIHQSNGRSHREKHRHITEPPGSTFRHRAHHHGLYATDALRRIGGYDAGFQIGYDTLLVNLVRMTAPVANLSEPVYHRRVRPGSLTQDADTGYQSAHRRRVRATLREVYATIFSAYQEYCAGQRSREDLLNTIQSETDASRRCRSDVTGKERDVQRLRAVLRPSGEKSRTAMATRPGDAHAESPKSATGPSSSARNPSLEALINQLETSPWTLSPTTLHALAQRLREVTPGHVIEVGSGVSTAVLAHYAAAHDARITTLEHKESFYRKTDQLLRRTGLREAVDLRHGPLKPMADRPASVWYDVDLRGVPPASFALIDAPPMARGRDGALPALLPHLSSGWEIWLDDAHRRHERDCLRDWSGDIAFSAHRRDEDEKGQWILQDAADGRPAVHSCHAARVACTLLTGQRPEFLRETLIALQNHSPGFLKHATLIVLINGPDPDTRAMISDLDHTDRVQVHDGPLLSIGDATSRLMAEVQTLPDAVDTVLHLEDDWRAHTYDAGWLERGLRLLDTDGRIGQVRLRDTDDRVLRHHMITGAPIQWTKCDGDRRAASAHFTFNPSLVRRTDLSAIFPCRDETAAQRGFVQAGFASAQLVPGTFTHIGDADSLRLRSRQTVTHRE